VDLVVLVVIKIVVLVINKPAYSVITVYETLKILSNVMLTKFVGLFVHLMLFFYLVIVKIRLQSVITSNLIDCSQQSNHLARVL